MGAAAGRAEPGENVGIGGNEARIRGAAAGRIEFRHFGEAEIPVDRVEAGEKRPIALGRRHWRVAVFGEDQLGAGMGKMLGDDFLHAGADPLLLLDDPVAELDRGRAARVLSLLTSEAPGQVLLAVPRDDDIPSALTSLPRRRVREGTVSDA